jgi:L-alanine-DL-glutamate epimerase-like enolase superfamily enzyme
VIDAVRAGWFEVPTDAPESDGTFAWDATTVVEVELEAGGERGHAWTYGPRAVAAVVEDLLAPVLVGRDPDRGGAWDAMRAALRNAGRPGIGMLAVSAADLALHDLRSRMRGVTVAELLGPVRDEVAVYGSGGFCSYGDERLREQLAGWAAQGLRAVKMKVGRDPGRDLHRVAVAREAVGDDVDLMVDANGAYDRRDAVRWAHRFAAGAGVTWLEEPVPQDDVEGLRFVRDHAPADLAIASGEYVWEPAGARRLLEAGAVDVLQADVTRCGGVTGVLQIDALCDVHDVPLSLHCAPALSAPVALALRRFVHLEWFHDHVRIEQARFGLGEPDGGTLHPTTRQEVA